ncbi:hypothetical protein RU10_25360, partial [Pseudomonas fluorescens]
PGMQIKYSSQINPVSTGPNVSHVATPHSIGDLDIEFTLQMIGGVLRLRTAGFVTMPAPLLTLQPELAHQATSHVTTHRLFFVT